MTINVWNDIALEDLAIDVLSLRSVIGKPHEVNHGRS